MSLYTNLLVPVLLEGSDREKLAIEAAKALCKPDGKVTLMHVVEEPSAHYAYPILDQALAESVEEADTRLAKMIKEDGLKAEKFVTRGHSSRSILEHAESDNSDCIIIASHQPGLEDYLLGSTAARVVRHAKCPVHVLR